MQPNAWHFSCAVLQGNGNNATGGGSMSSPANGEAKIPNRDPVVRDVCLNLPRLSLIVPALSACIGCADASIIHGGT